MLEKLLKGKTVYCITATSYLESDCLIESSDILKRNGLYLCSDMIVYASKEEALEKVDWKIRFISEHYENVVIKKDGLNTIIRYEEATYDAKFRMEYRIIETKIV